MGYTAAAWSRGERARSNGGAESGAGQQSAAPPTPPAAPDPRAACATGDQTPRMGEGRIEEADRRGEGSGGSAPLPEAEPEAEAAGSAEVALEAAEGTWRPGEA